LQGLYTMRSETLKSSLSPERKKLLELMQEINNGRIEGIQVRDSEPLFDPPPTTYKLFIFDKPNIPNASIKKQDYMLKRRVVELFDLFDEMKSFYIKELTISDGLPIRMFDMSKNLV
ncbi:MAG: hypothetical protein ABIK28_12515, partial [Planctomycetota bacterium]